MNCDLSELNSWVRRLWRFYIALGVKSGESGYLNAFDAETIGAPIAAFVRGGKLRPAASNHFSPTQNYILRIVSVDFFG